jgi:hypothetical protein
MNNHDKISLARAYLSLFSVEQRTVIVDAIRNSSSVGLQTDLSPSEEDESKPLPILSFLPKTATADETRNILMAFSVMACHALTSEKDEDYWRDMLMQVFHLSDKYASALAAEIATQDTFSDIEMINKDTGESETITQWMSKMWKHVRHPFTDEENLPTEKDYDIINEMYGCGKALKSVLRRVRLGLGTSSQLIGDQFMMNLVSATESGDPDPLDDDLARRMHRSIFNAITPAPYGDVEEGALTRLALRGAKKVRASLIRNIKSSQSPILRTKLIRGVPKFNNQLNETSSGQDTANLNSNDNPLPARQFRRPPPPSEEDYSEDDSQGSDETDNFDDLPSDSM